MLALGSEELRPGHDLGVLLEQGAALAFGHPAPHTELDSVVQRISAAFGDHRTVPTDDSRLALCGTTYEQFIGVGAATTGLRNPGDAGLGFGAVDGTLR